MACNSLEAFLGQCGKVTAGIKENYIIAYDDLAALSGTTEYFAESINGVVNALGLDSGKKFVKVKNTRKSQSFKETRATAENGVETTTVEYVMGIDTFNAANRAFTESLSGREVVIIAKQKSGQYMIVGLDGGFYLSNSELTVDETNNSRVLTFTGEQIDLTRVLDATLVASLTVAVPQT